MTHKPFLPTRYKKAGFALLLIGAIAGIVLHFHDFPGLVITMPTLFSEDTPGLVGFAPTSIADEITVIMLIAGILLVAFSREQVEDEGIMQLRLSSLMWAVLINYCFLAIITLFTFDTVYLKMLIYNMFTVGLLFIARFNFLLYFKYRPNNYEKHP